MRLVKDSKAELQALEDRLIGSAPIAKPVSIKAQIEATRLVVEKELAPIVSRLDTLEIKTLIPIERGEQGKAGRDGKDGKNGEPGRDGIDGRDGRDGKDGKDGKKGDKGDNGASIVDVEIALDDHLVFTRSDGVVIDAGKLPSSDGRSSVFVAGNGYQITVSETEPSDPQINDLWLDIS